MARLSGVRNERSAREGWAAWFKMAEESGIPALVKFSRLKEKRLDGLVVHALHPISTGKLEALQQQDQGRKENRLWLQE